MPAPAPLSPRPSLDAIQRDAALRRALFPITGREVFLAHAGVSPLPQAAVDAVTAEARNGALMHQEVDYLTRLRQARESAASLFGAQPDEVALLGPTSLGLSLVAAGLDWRPGDEVVFYGDDYPANVYPWRDLGRLGVKPVPLRPEHTGEITPELVADAVTPRCRLVALASAHYLSGVAIDAAAIGRIAHEAGALFCLDAIQTLGALRTPIGEADFIAADSHKWMLGPLGAGVFIVKERALAALRPALLGAENIRSPHFVAAEAIEPVAGAARYESGARNMLGIAGMKASLDLIAAIGIDAIEAHLARLRAAAISPLRDAGFEFLARAPEALRGGILTFRHPRGDMKRLFAKLAAARITASLRWTRDGREWIRFSPHLYVTEEDIARAVGALMP